MIVIYLEEDISERMDVHYNLPKLCTCTWYANLIILNNIPIQNLTFASSSEDSVRDVPAANADRKH